MRHHVYVQPLHRGVVIALVVALFAVVGGSSFAASSASVSTGTRQAASGMDPKLHAMLPASVQKAGVINAATNAEYPPYEYLGSNGKTVLGIDPELAGAVGTVLGIKFKFINIPWSSVIPGVESGRYLLAWSDATDLKSREVKADILDYVRSGQGFMWKSGGHAINTVYDSCGLKIGVNQGSDAVGYVTSISKKCTAAGKPAINMLTFPSQDTATLAIRSGRIDATVNASETNAWVAKHSHGSLVAGGPVFYTGVSGIVFPKHSPLLKPIRLALNKVKAAGAYKRIFAKYGIPNNVLQKFTVNSPTAYGSTG